MTKLKTTALALAASILASLGCQQYVFEPVSPSVIVVSNETYQLTEGSADILFVVDDSGSMAGEQANLSANFDTFITTIEQINQEREADGKDPIDYRIAVTTTSVRSTFDLGSGAQVFEKYSRGASDPACASKLTFAAGDPYPAGAFVAAAGNQKILDSNQLSSAEIIRQFKENVQVGTCGAGQEMGLLAAKLALEKQPDFVRDGSKLVLIFLSDEEDCSDAASDSSPDGNFVSVTVAGTQTDHCVEEVQKAGDGALGPASVYADFFKSQAVSVSVGMVVSGNGSPLVAGVCEDLTCNNACGSPSPKGPPCYCGGVSGGSRYLDVASQLDSLSDSICQSDFAPTLEALARVVTDIDVIKLTAVPFDDDPSLVVLKIIRPGLEEPIICTSPQKGQACATDDVDWEYLPPPDGPAIKMCNKVGSTCQIQPGDAYKVSFVESACSAERPCP